MVNVFFSGYMTVERKDVLSVELSSKEWRLLAYPEVLKTGIFFNSSSLSLIIGKTALRPFPINYRQ